MPAQGLCVAWHRGVRASAAADPCAAATPAAAAPSTSAAPRRSRRTRPAGRRSARQSCRRPVPDTMHAIVVRNTGQGAWPEGILPVRRWTCQPALDCTGRFAVQRNRVRYRVAWITAEPPPGSPTAGRPVSALQQPRYDDPADLRACSRSCPRCRRSSCPGRSSACGSDSPRRSAASVSAAGRRLRRDVSRTANPTRSRRKLKILLQMSLVLLHGLQEAHHPRRPHGRPVREAALGRYRDPRWCYAAELPRRLVNRPEFAAADREPDPGAAAARLRARGADAEFRARADRRRVCGPASPGILGSRIPAALAAQGAVPEDRRLDRDSLDFFERCTGGADRTRADQASISSPATKACICTTSRRRRVTCRAAALVQPVDAHALDRHAHRASSTARTWSISAASPIPIGVKVGPGMDAG